MAGKKKVQDEAVNKTARKNQQKGKSQDSFIPAAPENLRRIISLGGGTHAYLLDPRDGKTHHLAVGSDKWNALLADLAETKHADHINAELEALGWRTELSTVSGTAQS